MIKGKLVSFRNNELLVDDIINNTPDNVIFEDLFTHSLSLYRVYVIKKGLKVVTIHIGDDENGYVEIQKFLKGKNIIGYAFFDDREEG